MTREELGNNISAYIATITMGCTNIEITSAIMKGVDLYAPRTPPAVEREAEIIERCAQIAEAIDSGRGNEKEIAKAIRTLAKPSVVTRPERGA